MAVNRIIYLDCLRVAAITAVIIIHIAASQWYITPVNTFNWRVLNIYDSLARWCVPIFIMISGALFLNPSKNISKKDLFCKYIKRILIANVFWGFLYGFFSLFIRSFIQHQRIMLYDGIIQISLIRKIPWINRYII